MSTRLRLAKASQARLVEDGAAVPGNVVTALPPVSRMMEKYTALTLDNSSGTAVLSGHLLGEGAFGKVFRAEARDGGDQVAVKQAARPRTRAQTRPTSRSSSCSPSALVENAEEEEEEVMDDDLDLEGLGADFVSVEEVVVDDPPPPRGCGACFAALLRRRRAARSRGSSTSEAGKLQVLRGLELEIAIMSALPPHSNIVDVLGAYQDPKHVYIVMEEWCVTSFTSLFLIYLAILLNSPLTLL